MPKPVRTLRLLATLGLALALGLAWATLGMVQDYRRMAGNGIAAEGRMTGSVREVRSSGRGRTTSHYPGFSFRTAEGRIVLATSADAVEPGEIRAGRVMPLLYDPADPSVIRLAKAVGDGPGALPWLLGGLSLLLGGAAGWSLVTGRAIRLNG